MRRNLLPVVLWSSLSLAVQLMVPAFSGQGMSSGDQETGRLSNHGYILGVGDTLFVEVRDLPEESITATIGPDGTIYLPRLRALNIEGLTVEELRYFLVDQLKKYIRSPDVFITIIGYRPVRVYVGGEITRPGYYVMSPGGGASVKKTLDSVNNVSSIGTESMIQMPDMYSGSIERSSITPTLRWPSLFDALREAEGITPYSDLSDVRVIRKIPIYQGGGKAQANVNFLSLITQGDESVNIRLFDGDVITVGRSKSVLKEQLLIASKSNLSPDYITVYLSGRVREPGTRRIPQGSTLNQAIASAGGTKMLKGSVEFLRFGANGSVDRRKFGFNSTAAADSAKNPILMSGDIIRVNDSLLSSGVELLNEVTGPAVGIYSVYSLFK